MKRLYPISGRFLASAAAGGLLICSTATAAANDTETQRVFQSLYGEEIRQVRNSLDPADDMLLAERLLSDARSLADRPQLASIMAEQAYDLGSKDREGYETAIDAARFLMGLTPEVKADALQKILNLQQRNYRLASGPERLDAGRELMHTLIALADVKAQSDKESDLREAISLYLQADRAAGVVQYPNRAEIAIKRNQAAMRRGALDRIDLLQTRLENNPRITQPHEDILRLYLVELDKPEKAMEYLDKVENVQLKKFVPLAIQPISELNEDELVLLAEWYGQLADSAPIPARPSMLRHSRSYYQRFIELHPEEDLRHLKAKLAIKKANETLGDDGSEDDDPFFEPVDNSQQDNSSSTSASEEKEENYDMFGF